MSIKLSCDNCNKAEIIEPIMETDINTGKTKSTCLRPDGYIMLSMENEQEFAFCSRKCMKEFVNEKT